MKTSSMISRCIFALMLATNAARSQTLFSTNSPQPPGTAIRSDGPYTIGNVFTVANQDLLVNKLGVQDVYGSGFYASSVQAGLWSGDGSTLLASATVSSSDPLSGGYRYHSLTSPVTLTHGVTYLIGAKVGASIAYFYDSGASNLLGGNTAIFLGDARYDGSGAFAAPTTVGNTGSRWSAVNATFTTTGQPLATYFATNAPLPSGTTIRSDGPFTVGNAFTVTGSSLSVVDKLGVQDVYGNGFYAPSVQVGLWSGDGSTLLASVTVSSSDPWSGGYRYHALTSPVALSPGVTYLVGAEVGASIAYFYDSWNNAFVNANSAITITDCRYHSGSVLAAPLSSGGDSIARWAPANVSFIGGYSTTVTPATGWGTWYGWGCSLAWWANIFGQRTDLADLIFTTNNVILNGQFLPGLGLNIARYNAGASGTNAVGTQYMVASPNIQPFQQIQGYWLNPNSTDPASSSWNWSYDANQRQALLNASARGADYLQLFSNSPLWWMCDNYNPSGSPTGFTDNLNSGDYDLHAIYLATIAKYAADNWGIYFNGVEAFNEPIADWWTATGTQEGCHFATSTQSSVIGYLRTELNSRGLNWMNVDASDENTYDQGLSTWNSFNSTTRGNINCINVHGYEDGSGNRAGLYSAASSAGKVLWNTEYGDGDASGMSLTSNLNLDFSQLHPTGWCYWQPLDGGGWGLIQSTPGNGWIGNANRKYFALAQYSRHIREGMTIIGSGDANTVAAYNATNHSLVLVTANYGTAQWITYNLSNFSSAAGPARQWTTVTGPGPGHQPGANIPVNQRFFCAFFPANSIETFEVQNVNDP
jgi:galactan endo-1,6-beta-galactosidase